MTTTPLVFVLTMLSVMGYWKQLPDVPDTVKAFVDVQQATQGFAPPPPTLPKSVPLHVKGPVDMRAYEKFGPSGEKLGSNHL